jgi:hypothetical protein
LYLVQVAELVGLDISALGTGGGSHTAPNALTKLTNRVAGLLQKSGNSFLVNDTIGTQVSLQKAFQVLSAHTNLANRKIFGFIFILNICVVLTSKRLTDWPKRSRVKFMEAERGMKDLGA